jgi:hypothetical protein
MATKKKPKGLIASEVPADVIPRDFVWCGRRFWGDKIVYCIRVINETPPEGGWAMEGQNTYGKAAFTTEMLGKERFYTWEPKASRFTIGAIYRGGRFNEQNAWGVLESKFEKMTNLPDALLWQAKDEQAEIEIKAQRIEKDAKRRDMIAEAMRPLRRYYSSLISYSDREALASAVLRALRQPLTTKEK